MTRQISVGGLSLGGGAPVRIQSMTSVPAEDTEVTGKQIAGLFEAGCEIVRVAVRNEKDAEAIRVIRESSPMPVVADIHFSARLAVAAAENGADKIRINPGNIGGEKQVKLVADCLKAHRIPVRVGANTGSIEKGFLERYGRSAEALVESALSNAAMLEKYGVEDIVLSVKASSVPLTVAAYRMLAARTRYPLHVGVTEAGTRQSGIVKSAVGIGALLLDGIGDTIRVSLSDDPVEEIYAAKRILRSVNPEGDFVEVVSCPTCGRCAWDMLPLAREIEERTFREKKKLKIAVMGCVVNGPGESADADIGIAGGSGKCVIYKKGVPVRTVASAEAAAVFRKMVEEMLEE